MYALFTNMNFLLFAKTIIFIFALLFTWLSICGMTCPKAETIPEQETNAMATLMSIIIAIVCISAGVAIEIIS